MYRKQVWGKEFLCVCQSAWVERKEKKKLRMKKKREKKSCEKNEKELKNMRKRVPKC